MFVVELCRALRFARWLQCRIILTVLPVVWHLSAPVVFIGES